MKKSLAVLLSVLMVISTITCMLTVTTAQAETNVVSGELISNGDFENTTLNAVGTNMDGLRGTRNLSSLLNGKWYRATGGLSFATYGDLSAYDEENDVVTKATETEYATYFTACSTVIAQPDDATNHIGRFNQTLFQAMNFNAEEETFTFKAKVKSNTTGNAEFLIGFVGLQTEDGTSAVDYFYNKYTLEVVKSSGNFTTASGDNGKIAVTLANPTEWTDMEIVFKATKVADPTPTRDNFSILDTDFTMLQFYHESTALSSGDNGKNYRKQGMYVDDVSIKGYVNPFGKAEIYKDGELTENTNEAAGVELTVNGVKSLGVAVGDTVVATPRYNSDGLVFAGWYKGDELVTRDKTLTFTANTTDVYTPKFINKNLLTETAGSFESYAADTSLLVPTNTTFPEAGTWGANKVTGYYGATYAETIYDVNGIPYTQEAKNSPEGLTNAPVNVKTDYAYTGNNSLYVYNNYRALSTALNVEKNTNYTLSYYAFAPNGKIMAASGIVTTLNIGRTNGTVIAGQPVDSEGNAVAELYKALADFSSSFTLAKSAKLTFDGENWQKVTINFNSGNFEKLYFAIAPSTDAYFYIDDLCLIAEEEAAATVDVKFVNTNGEAITNSNLYAKTTVIDDFDGSKVLSIDYENESGAYLFAGWYDADNNLLNRDEVYDYEGDLEGVYAKIISKNILDGSASFEGYANNTSLQVTNNTKYPEQNEWGLTKNAGYYGASYEEVIYDKYGFAYQQTASGSPEAIGSSKMLVVNEAAYKGNSSLRFTFSSRSMVSGLTVTPYTNYTLTYYILAGAGTSAPLKYTGVATTLNLVQNKAVTPIDEGAVLASQLTQPIGNLPAAVAMDMESAVTLSETEWKKITFTFNSGRFDKLYLCLCPNTGVSTAYIDELSLVAEEKPETVSVKLVDANGDALAEDAAANVGVTAGVTKDIYTGVRTATVNYETGAYTFLGWYNAANELVSANRELVVTGSVDGMYAKVQNNNLLTYAASYEGYANATSLKYTGTDYPSGVYFGGNKNAGYLGATFAETIYNNKGEAIEQTAGGTVGASSVNAVISTEKAHSGDNSVRITNSYWTASMGIDVNPNTDYALSYYIFAPKKVEDETNTIQISAISTTVNTGTSGAGSTAALNQATNLYLDSKDLTAVHDGENWIKVTHTFNSMNLNKVYLVLGQTADTQAQSCWAYIDDMTMIETTPTTMDVEMKSCASLDLVDASMDGLYIDQELTFKVIDNMDTDAVVTFNGEVITANIDGTYTVILADENAISVRFDGDENLPWYDEDEFGRKLNVNNLDVYSEPVWEGDTVYHETALFTPDKDTVKLLYPVDSIVSLRSYDLTQNYIEGYDFEITEDGQIKRLEGGRIPVWGSSLVTDTVGDWKTNDGRYVVLTGDTTYPKYAISVTYKHSTTFADGFTPVAPEAQQADLNNVLGKLARGEEVNIVVYGDSISCGWSSSGMNPSIKIYDETNTEGNYITRYNINVAPFAPTWIQMLEAKLKEMYPDATINFKNLSLGGKSAPWGAEKMAERLALWKDEEGNQVVPDLMLTGFGVNDCNNYINKVNNGEAITKEQAVETFKTNMQAIVDIARDVTGNNNMEVLMYSPMFPNQNAIYWPADVLLSYENAMVEIANADDNIGVLKLSSIFSEIVKNKDAEDYLNTNLNHGNDFTARLYYNGILAAMARDENVKATGDANGDEQVNLKDLVALARFAAGWEIEINEAVMDLNYDGKVDLLDVTYLARHLAGWDDSPIN
ncbi:MAG: hypothetical protein IJC36_01785 [Clostridia bacterium]|nr:hypothetical protein [Clostridia bacterium]